MNRPHLHQFPSASRSQLPPIKLSACIHFVTLREDIIRQSTACQCVCMLLRVTIRMEKASKLVIAEGFARVLSMVLASAAAIVIGLDAQTSKVMFVERRAYVKDLPALWVATIIAAVAAGYQFVQVCRCLVVAWVGKNPCKGSKCLLWLCLLFDQGVAYVLFAASLAAAQGSLVALTGVKQLQWEKLCHFYPRFCIQAAIGIIICAVASVVMAVVSSISAYRLFRLYPPSDRRSLPRAARWSLF